MKTQITSFKELYIPKPCHEDWDEMTPAEQGKFCGNCRKMVYDFTDKTEEDFNRLYKLDNNICVRFNEDQIDQDFIYVAGYKRKAVVDRLRRVAAFLVMLVTLKIASIRDGFAQSEIKNSIKTEVVAYNSDDRKNDGELGELKGQVRISNTEEGVGNASVKLYDAKDNLVASTTTLAQGYFNLSLPSSVEPDQVFSIMVEKAREKKRSTVIRYSTDKKKITQKDFESILLSIESHSRWRRNILGRRYRTFVGCPKFR